MASALFLSILLVLISLRDVSSFLFNKHIALRPIIHNRVPLTHPVDRGNTALRESLDSIFGLTKDQTLPPVVEADVERLAFLLANVTDALEHDQGRALSLASQNLDFLTTRNIPKVAEKMLADFPALREDAALASGFTFLMDFVEVVGKEMSTMVRRNEDIMKSLFDALKTSEAELDKFLAENREKLTSPEFMLYLDMEIRNQDPQSEMYALLVTAQLRLLDEYGKTFGVDVMMLPHLAAEETYMLRKTKTLNHISNYDLKGKQLFHQTLNLMISEMTRRYHVPDPTLITNLREIEQIVAEDIARTISPMK